MPKSLSGGSADQRVSNLTVESLTSDQIVAADSVLSLTSIPPGTNGQVLTAQTSGPPIFQNAPGGTNANNLAAGTAFAVPYQSAPSITAFAGAATGIFSSIDGVSPPSFNNAPVMGTATFTNATGERILATDSSKTLVSIANGNMGEVLTIGAPAATPSFQPLPAANVSTAIGVLDASKGGSGVSTTPANTLFSGPTSGGAATPAFRNIVNADLPAIDLSNSQTIGVNTIAKGGTGANTFNNGEILIGPSTGGPLAPTRRRILKEDIDQVNAAAIQNVVSIANGGTGTNVTTSAFVFAGPTSGPPGAPSFRNLVTNDLPILDLTIPGVDVTGTLQIDNGGTGSNFFAQGAILMGPVSSGGTPTRRRLVANDLDSLNASSITGLVGPAQGGTGVATALANHVFTSNGGAPLFRALGPADLPALDLATGSITGVLPLAKGGVGASGTWTAGQLLIGTGGSGGAVRQLTQSDIPSIDAGKIASGVLSQTFGGTGFSVVSQKLVFAGPASGTGTPTFVTLTSEYLPPIALNSAPSQVTGILPQSFGGTGVSTVNTNLVFAGPTSGGAANPTFRTLIDADISSLSAAKINAGILPVTYGGTGTNLVGANLFFAGPVSGSAAPTFRTLALGDMAQPNYAHLRIMAMTNNFGVGNITYQTTSGMVVGRKNTGHAIGDRFEIKFTIAAGTYNLELFGAQVSNSGIWDFTIDGAGTPVTFDMYNGTTTGVYGQVIGSLTVATSGEHFLRGEVTSKNPSSTGYYGYFASFNIR